MSKRLHAMGVNGYEKGFSTISLMEDRLSQPLKRKKPTLYFVNSMSDLFHEKVPFDYIDKVMEVIELSPHHAYQILTKRAGRMKEYFETHPVPSNAWLGVSVEDKQYGKPRISELQKINAKTRFLSIEPLLEDVGTISLKGIHWVIVGGESGPKARPMLESWVINIKRQCQRSKTKFFFKQWGAWGDDGIKRSKQANGRKLQGKTWDQIPVVAI
jgi:protein gp37